MAPSVGVVIPAYRPDLDRLRNYITGLDSHLSPQTILVEIDEPQAEVLESLTELPFTVNTSPQRRGKGAAITNGFETLKTDILAFADADGATPVSSFEKVVNNVLAGQVNLAVGSRRHPEAKVRTHQTIARRYLGDTFAWIARQLLEVPLYDYQCGAKSITREGWNLIREHLYAPGFAWDVEVIAIAGALGLQVAEVPVEWDDCPGSTVSPVRDSLRLGQALIAAQHRAKCLQDSYLHTAISDRYGESPALINRYE